MEKYKIRVLEEYLNIIGQENVLTISPMALRERVRRRLKKKISIKKIFVELIKNDVLEKKIIFDNLEKYDIKFKKFMNVLNSMTTEQKKCCKRYLNNFFKNN